MPRRSSSPFAKAFAIVLVIAAIVAALLLVRFWPEPQPDADRNASANRIAPTTGVDAGTGAASTAAGSCPWLRGEMLASSTRGAFSLKPIAVPSGSAAAACELVHSGTRYTILKFDAASLAASEAKLTPSAYFDSVAAGFEYEFKVAPIAMAGIGERALVAGADGEFLADAGQVVWQRGDTVYSLDCEKRMLRGRFVEIARWIDASLVE